MTFAYAVSTCLGFGIIIGLFVYYLNHKDRIIFAYILFLLSITLTDLLHFLSSYFELFVANTIVVVYTPLQRMVPDLNWFRFIKMIAGSSFIATLPFFINRFLNPEKKLKFVNITFLALYIVLVVFDFHLYFTDLIIIKSLVFIRNTLWSSAITAAILYTFILFILLNKNIQIKEIKYFFIIVLIVASIVIPIFIFNNVLNLSIFSGIIPSSFDIRPLFFIIWHFFNIIYFAKYLFRLSQQQQFGLPNDSDLDRYVFTKREKQVLLLLLHGESYNSICEKLFISLPTVKSHVYSIYKKTNMKNRISLLHFFQSDNYKN